MRSPGPVALTALTDAMRAQWPNIAAVTASTRGTTMSRATRRRRPVTIHEATSPGMKGVELHDTLGYAIENGAFRPPRTSARDVVLSPCRGCGGLMAGANFTGIWREHPRCKGDHEARVLAAGKALGLGVIEQHVAALVAGVAPRYSDQHPEPTWKEGERPQDAWAHVDRSALVAALQQVRDELQEAETPGPCALGACAWCGRLEDVAWFDHGHTWDDGTSAPLCSTCGPVYDRRGGSPRYYDDQRPGIAEAISGVPIMMGEADCIPAGLLAFAESDEASDGTPWSHLNPDAVEKYRWSRWLMLGGKHCPPEHREEAARRLAERDRQRAEAEQVPDHFGFGS